MKNNIFITIFTPTYNRAYILTKLYDSLVAQEQKNFEWLIIDDGSTDNTEDLVQKFQNENKINIRYVKQKNSGKYKAINKALDLAYGELFMIVDSDDYLTSNAIVLIKKYYEQIKNDNNFIGVVGLRGKNSTEPHTSYYNEKKQKNKYYDLEFIDSTFIDYRYKYKISGDRAEVCITEKMKKYKFPEINNEKFMNEGYIWNRIANDGLKFRYFNDIIYVTKYLSDGLSQNMKNIKLNSPENAAIENNEYIRLKKLPLKVRIKACANYYRYSIICKKTIKESFSKCNSKIISIVGIPMAFILLKK